MFAWEDLTRADIPGNPYPSDNAFNDLIFGVEGVDVVEPPQITCADIVVGNDPGECSAVVAAYNVTATGTPAPELTCEPPPGSVFPVGTTTVTCTATNSAGSATCTFTVTVLDEEAPSIAAQPGQNPGGKNAPAAGKNGGAGQNPNGFYQLQAQDNCDGAPEIYVGDSASGFVAGPFASGDVVKITQARGATPSSRAMAGAVVAHIVLNGDAFIYAVDDAGNASGPISLLVPPK